MGSFAWLDAIRQHLAVRSGTEEIKSAKSGTEVASLSYIKHLEDPEIKKNLNEYYKVRQDLAKWQEKPEKNQEKISDAAKKIAQFEIAYQDCVDFSNLKSIMEQGLDFAKNNEALIDKLAGETADGMIADIENWSKGKLGGLAGKVKGEWLQTAAGEEGREHNRPQHEEAQQPAQEDLQFGNWRWWR